MLPPSQGFLELYDTPNRQAMEFCQQMLDNVPKVPSSDSACIFCLLKDVDNPRAPRHQQGNPRIAFPKSFPIVQRRGKKKPVGWLVARSRKSYRLTVFKRNAAIDASNKTALTQIVWSGRNATPTKVVDHEQAMLNAFAQSYAFTAEILFTYVLAFTSHHANTKKPFVQ